jgi:hypothetical protein
MLVIVLTSISIAACEVFLPVEAIPTRAVSNTAACDVLGGPLIAGLTFGTDTPESTRTLLERDLGVTEIRDIYEDSTSLWWREDGKEWFFNYDADRTLARVDVTRISEALPTGTRVIDCFGEPDLYEAIIPIDQAPYLDVSLWYLDEGIILRSSTRIYGPSPPTATVTGDLAFSGAWYMKPGEAEEMLRTIYRFPLHHRPTISARDLQSLLRRIKPWPGSWEQVTIINCYATPEECK